MSLTHLLSIKSKIARTTTLASVLLGASLTLSACGGSEHEVKAVDRVNEAAEMARKNAPKHVPLKPEEIAPVSSAPATTTDAAADATAPAGGTTGSAAPASTGEAATDSTQATATAGSEAKTEAAPATGASPATNAAPTESTTNAVAK
ncbi:hypothetical protein [Psychrobacter sp.]|uniref:hypothetical protein n=1 Tax=Psychrobacter sp. TaxID=56811 RepID=UPI0025D76743|nr:hypothetical protein [Psychrobacter sp.]